MLRHFSNRSHYLYYCLLINLNPYCVQIVKTKDQILQLHKQDILFQLKCLASLSLQLQKRLRNQKAERKQLFALLRNTSFSGRPWLYPSDKEFYFVHLKTSGALARAHRPEVESQRRHAVCEATREARSGGSSALVGSAVVHVHDRRPVDAGDPVLVASGVRARHEKQRGHDHRSDDPVRGHRPTG